MSEQAMERDAGFSNSLPEYFMLTEEEMEEFRLEKSVTTAKVTPSHIVMAENSEKKKRTHMIDGRKKAT